MLGDEFLTRPRLSRIYYNGKYFDYPMTAKDVVGASASGSRPVARSRTLGRDAIGSAEADTFEEWVTTRFGRRLYDAFFRSYTEKVWGIPGLGDPLALGGAADQELLAWVEPCSRSSVSAASTSRR